MQRRLERGELVVAGPPPCSDAGNVTGAAGELDGNGSGAELPSFVPAQYREPILRSASRWNVSAGMLAAQLMAESGFNPRAVSPAGAQGIAQFMPGPRAPTGSAIRSTPLPRSTPRPT